MRDLAAGFDLRFTHDPSHRSGKQQNNKGSKDDERTGQH